MSTIDKIFPNKADLKPEIINSIPVHQKEYLINGEIKLWNGNVQEVLSPVCLIDGVNTIQQIVGSYPMMSSNEATLALNSAVSAYGNGKGKWPTMAVRDRIKCIEQFTFKMKEKRTEIVNLLMWEIGKSQKQSETEFDRTVEYINDTINELKNLDRISSKFEIKQGVIGQIRRSPLGVVLCMGPFNYPLNETFTTLIPALIMGNTIIFKPPKFGVLLHRPLLEAFRDSFPAGVINTVYGDGKEIITPLMTSGKVDVLAFIGSSKVADILKSQHPKPHRMRSILGLEAKNAGIVLEDADIEMTVKECLAGSLSYNGQRCTALKILFVHKSVADKFTAKFCEGVEKLKIGLPWDDSVDITPLPETGKTDYLNSLIEDAKQKGASVINKNGGIVNNTFMFPAVLFPVNPSMRVFHEEQFGPVVPIATFENIDEPLNFIVESNYGQQVSIFSNNSDKIATLVDVLVNQVSRVNINSQCQRGPDNFPFTGRKDSAEGTLSVSDALRAFSIRSLVAVKDNQLNKDILTEILKEGKSNFINTDFIF
jgi:glyceraldehyde-3-phosphate dehydrogenase (NADP+)